MGVFHWLEHAELIACIYFLHQRMQHHVAVAAVRTSIDLCDLVLVSIHRTRAFKKRIRKRSLEHLARLEEVVARTVKGSMVPNQTRPNQTQAKPNSTVTQT